MLYDMKNAISKLKSTFSLSETSSVSSASTYSKNVKDEDTIEEGWMKEVELLSLPRVTLNGYLPSTKNRLLTPDMCDELRNLMPTRIQLYTEWNLLYSLEQHGASLHSLYDNVKPEDKTPMRVGYVIIVKDKANGIFGAYSNEYFHPTDARRYYGNGECFLWRLDKVPCLSFNTNEANEANDTNDTNNTNETSDNNKEDKNFEWNFRGYPVTGLNEFAIYCTSNFLSMGAGDGHYGFWLDERLLKGVSDPSLTYGNDVLSKEGNKFHIYGIEVWRVG